MKSVRLILVGGFLGAGKTALLWEAGKRLAGQGRRVGLITNDQAPDLVDTALLARGGMNVQEVAGSCFCCNFPGLLDAAKKLIEQADVEVILAEPVGSCTDLSATIVQPLKDKYAREFILSPLSVLADPRPLKDILTGGSGGLHPSAAYIFRKQLEEADLIVLNKIDLLSAGELEQLRELAGRSFRGSAVQCISAAGGQGVEEWLTAVTGSGAAGRKIAEVDYDIYAEGEAVLGWLNAVIGLTSRQESTDWSAFCRSLMAAMQGEFQKRRAAVGHVKLLLSAPGGLVVANLTSTEGEISLRGSASVSAIEADMTLNARVEMPPQELEAIVRQALVDVAGEKLAARVNHLRSLSPGRPKPTYRYTSAR